MEHLQMRITGACYVLIIIGGILFAEFMSALLTNALIMLILEEDIVWFVGLIGVVAVLITLLHSQLGTVEHEIHEGLKRMYKPNEAEPISAADTVVSVLGVIFMVPIGFLAVLYTYLSFTNSVSPEESIISHGVVIGVTIISIAIKRMHIF